MKNISNINTGWGETDDLDYYDWMYYHINKFPIPLIDDPTSNFVFDEVLNVVNNYSMSAYIHYFLNFEYLEYHA